MDDEDESLQVELVEDIEDKNLIFNNPINNIQVEGIKHQKASDG